ncbi:hypothetical protein RZQ92_15080, partial [Klebsiella michiganensis]
RNPGNMPRRGIAVASSRLALRLAGLQGRKLLVTRSPDRCAASPPGRVLTLVDIVEQMLNQ